MGLNFNSMRRQLCQLPIYYLCGFLSSKNLHILYIYPTRVTGIQGYAVLNLSIFVQVTTKKAAIIEACSQLREKLSGTVSISQGKLSVLSFQHVSFLY